MRNIAKVLLTALVLGSQALPAPATDVRQMPWSQLLAESDAICRVRLVAAEERDDPGALTVSARSTFRTAASLRGACPPEITIPWTRAELLALDTVGSSWILFLTGERLALPPRGAWRIETREKLSWSPETVEVISPDSYLHLGGLPEALFSQEQLRVRYYSNLHLDFSARALRVDLLEAWLKSQARPPGKAENDSSTPR